MFMRYLGSVRRSFKNVCPFDNACVLGYTSYHLAVKLLKNKKSDQDKSEYVEGAQEEILKIVDDSDEMCNVPSSN